VDAHSVERSDPHRELRPGMFARGSVVMSERGCPSSPWCRSASAYTSIAPCGGKAALAEVQAGLRTPDEVEIRQACVVATGQTRLRDGAAGLCRRGTGDRLAQHHGL
jgi:hypothetical protein